MDDVWQEIKWHGMFSCKFLMTVKSPFRYLRWKEEEEAEYKCVAINKRKQLKIKDRLLYILFSVAGPYFLFLFILIFFI
jgi:hypothetical protein